MPTKVNLANVNTCGNIRYHILYSLICMKKPLYFPVHLAVDLDKMSYNTASVWVLFFVT